MATESEKHEAFGRLVIDGMESVRDGERMLAASGLEGTPSYETTITTADGEDWTITVARAEPTDE